MTVLFCVCLLFGTYIRRFGKDFEEEDKGKVTAFTVALLVIAVVLAFLTD